MYYYFFMKPDIILTKQEIHWHIINDYLNSISGFCVSHKDEKFNKLLSEIQSYVNKKLAPDGNGDIIDIYVLVSQEPDN